MPKPHPKTAVCSPATFNSFATSFHWSATWTGTEARLIRWWS